MLAELAVSDPAESSDRPLKRRKAAKHVVADTHVSVDDRSADDHSAPTASSRKGRQKGIDHGLEAVARQTIEDYSPSENESDSDFEFEDVDLAVEAVESGNDRPIEDLSIPLESTSALRKDAQRRRKPVSTAERTRRVLVHKLHILALLGHCICLNTWCNDSVAQNTLQNVLSSKTKSMYLNMSPRASQFDRNRGFMEGLQQAANAFRGQFSISESGMRRPNWYVNDEDRRDDSDGNTEISGRKEIRGAAKRMAGSQDMGNQLFCAMLRSVGVEARLVCSLQVLPFASSGIPKGTTASTPAKPTFNATYSKAPESGGETSNDESAVRSSAPSLRDRLRAQASPTLSSLQREPRQQTRKIHRLNYPVFWVEAFNEAQQKWVSVDAIVTQTVGKPFKLEPPMAYSHNRLLYVIAFEADGAAKDVTARYAKLMNAKTRRERVESTPDGTAWWQSTMRLFRRRRKLDRDTIEDIELTQRLAREGMPANIQDFKNHPVYALERHLARHEVIHPHREVAKMNAGTAANPKMESVYRRGDVLACRSVEKWFRSGREIREGEQPLKFVSSRRPPGRRKALDADEEGSGGEKAELTGLYAAFQTELYVPPPVVHGRVPRNAFGNIDLYVPSMVPAGGVHIGHPLTGQAARILRVDYADAVTGFKFQGRKGSAIIEGAVIAIEFEPAINAMIEGLEYMEQEDKSQQRSILALQCWKKFLTGLRIADRVKKYGTGEANAGDANEAHNTADERRSVQGSLGEDGLQNIAHDEDPLLSAGQYTLFDTPASRSGQRRKNKRARESSESEAAFTDNGSGEEYVPAGIKRRKGGRRGIFDAGGEEGSVTDVSVDVHDVDHHAGTSGDDDQGGGFIPDDDGTASEEAGGFLVEERNTDDAASVPATRYQHIKNVGYSHSSDDIDVDSSPVEQGEHKDTFGGFIVDEHKIASAPDNQLRPKANDPSTSENAVEQRNDVVLATSTANLVTEELADQENETSKSPPSFDIDRRSGCTLESPSAHNTDNAGIEAADADTGLTLEAEEDKDDDSMLSEDPDDIDAEPDWLESD